MILKRLLGIMALLTSWITVTRLASCRPRGPVVVVTATLAVDARGVISALYAVTTGAGAIVEVLVEVAPIRAVVAVTPCKDGQRLKRMFRERKSKWTFLENL